MFTEADRGASGPGRAALRCLARFFFPSRCLACRLRPLDRLLQGGICAVCWSEVALPAPIRCLACDEPLETETDTLCGRCLLVPPPFSSLRAAAPYRGTAREILLAFKFRGADYLARHLATLMVRRIPPPAHGCEVVAVPAARSARRRSDHAAELLAAAVARRLDLPLERRLEKCRETERQSRLPFARREGNVRGAFRPRGDSEAPVLLVDDVVTSGATARECARQLRAAGAPDVVVWCFARAARQDADLEPASSSSEPLGSTAISEGRTEVSP